MKAAFIAPPALPGEGRIPRRLSAPKLSYDFGELCGDGSAASDIKDSGLIRAIFRGDERIPEEGPKQRPEGQSDAVHSCITCLRSAFPRLESPPYLFVHATTEMHFGEGDGQLVSSPGLVED